MGRFNRVAILVNHEKPGAAEAICKVSKWAADSGLSVVLNENPEQDLNGSPFGEYEALDLIRLFADCDLLISLGGDGTLLFASQVAIVLDVPVFSVNLGSLGFHTQVNMADLEDYLNRVGNDRFQIENRLMLEAELKDIETGELQKCYALNDIVVSKSVWGHMVSLRMSIDGEVVTDINADALIVATPTGSSAYNYAANGPVLHPKMKNIVINTICPHRMKFTPLVVPSESAIDIEFRPKRKVDESQILIDGQYWLPIMPHGHLKISGTSMYLRLIIFENDFYGNLREKLRWGGLF